MRTLGKTFSNEELIIKILRCLNRSWQPNFTMICESKNLETMDIHTHTLSLVNCMNKKKRKNIALKATNIEDMESEDEGCQSEINKFMKLMFKKFKEFLNMKKKLQDSINKVKKARRPFLLVINAETNGIYDQTFFKTQEETKIKESSRNPKREHTYPGIMMIWNL